MNRQRLNCFPGIPRGCLLTSVGLWIAMIFLALQAAADTTSVDPLFEGLRQRLIDAGFDAERVESLYRQPGVSFETRGVSLFFVHSEARLDYDQFLSLERLRKARDYLNEHLEALERAESEFGVEREVITAILLVETQLGTITGRQSALNILSSMAALSNSGVREQFWKDIDSERRLPRDEFEAKADRRSEWAFNELKALLTYVEREQIDPLTIPSSYAGAMGICQFMPSNALTLGVDGNGDGRVDLFDHSDAIASVANYLKHHGWKPNMAEEQSYRVILRYNYSRPYAETILKLATRLKG
ncbi:MAG: lytic murein transglycosylase [Desulfobacterales bacterium]